MMQIQSDENFRSEEEKGPGIIRLTELGVSGNTRLSVMSTAEETVWHRSLNGFSIFSPCQHIALQGQ